MVFGIQSQFGRCVGHKVASCVGVFVDLDHCIYSQGYQDGQCGSFSADHIFNPASQQHIVDIHTQAQEVGLGEVIGLHCVERVGGYGIHCVGVGHKRGACGHHVTPVERINVSTTCGYLGHATVQQFGHGPITIVGYAKRGHGIQQL